MMDEYTAVNESEFCRVEMKHLDILREKRKV